MTTSIATQTLRVFSYGGGWQSNAALVLAAQGRIDFRTFIFADVGCAELGQPDDSEKNETIAYIRDYARPFADVHGLELDQAIPGGIEVLPFDDSDYCDLGGCFT